MQEEYFWNEVRRWGMKLASIQICQSDIIDPSVKIPQVYKAILIQPFNPFEDFQDRVDIF